MGSNKPCCKLVIIVSINWFPTKLKRSLQPAHPWAMKVVRQPPLYPIILEACRSLQGLGCATQHKCMRWPDGDSCARVPTPAVRLAGGGADPPLAGRNSRTQRYGAPAGLRAPAQVHCDPYEHY